MVLKDRIREHGLCVTLSLCICVGVLQTLPYVCLLLTGQTNRQSVFAYSKYLLHGKPDGCVYVCVCVRACVHVFIAGALSYPIHYSVRAPAPSVCCMSM